MLRTLLDTNVLVAAARHPGSAPSQLVEMAGRGLCEVVVTEPLLQEASRTFVAEFGRPAGRDGYGLLARMPRRHVVWAFQWEHFEGEVAERVSDRRDIPHVCAFLGARGDLFVTLDGKLRKMPIRGWVRFASPADALQAIRLDVSRQERE